MTELRNRCVAGRHSMAAPLYPIWVGLLKTKESCPYNPAAYEEHRITSVPVR